MTIILDVVGVLIAIVVIVSIVTRHYQRSARTFEEMFPYLRGANVEDVHDLVDPADEGYLRLNLSPLAFRRAQQNRVHLLRELLKRMSHNASFLQEWASGELGKSWKTLDRNARHASREVIQYCLLFRFTALVVRFRLLVWSARLRILPFMPVPLLAEARSALGTDVAYTYERIRETAGKLCRLCGAQYETKLTGIL